MPAEPVTELLSPEGAILKDPTDVERALSALWKTAGLPASKPDAKREGKPDGQPSTEAKTRVCMANLVLVARAGEWNELSAVLARLARDYPTRTLTILLGDQGVAADPHEQVRAAVSSICHIPHPGRPQVCAEQILLRTGSESGAGMDRVLLPLLASDMPLLAWWTVGAETCAELLKSLRQMVDRMVFDAGVSVFPRLLDPCRCVSRELGWFRSYRRRELIAQLFDEASPATLSAIERVSISLQGGVSTDRIDALWMMAFVAGQLNWRPERVLGPGRWELRSSSTAVEMTLDERAGTGRGLHSFEVQAGQGRFQFTRCGEDTDEFQIMISNAEAGHAPRSIQLSRRERADSLVVALTGRAVDRSYDRAVPLAVWMADALNAGPGARPSG